MSNGDRPATALEGLRGKPDGEAGPGPLADADAIAGGTDPLRRWVSRRYSDLQPAAGQFFTAAAYREAIFVTVLRPATGMDAPPSTATEVDGQIEVPIPRGDAGSSVTVVRLG